MHQIIALESLAASIEGLHSVNAVGSSSFLEPLISGHARIPSELWGEAFLLEVRFQRAPQLRYLLWAAWLHPGHVLQPELQPLEDFRMGLAPHRRALPMLLLARAESRFGTPPMWDPRFSHLMDERNPHRATDGRLLLLASSPPSTSSVKPALAGPVADLTRGLSCYLATLTRSQETTLPEGCFVIRSGIRQLTISAAPSLRFVATPARTSEGVWPKGYSGKPVPLSHGLQVHAQFDGLLLWGAWRGDPGYNPEVTRFVAQTCRAESATRMRVSVHQDLPAGLRQDLADQVLRSIGLPTAPASADAILARAAEALTAAVGRDGRLVRARRRPYQLVLEQKIPAPARMVEAVSLMEPPLLPGGGILPGAGFVPSGEPKSFGDFVSQNRDLPLLVSPSLVGASGCGGRSFVPRCISNVTAAISTESPSKPNSDKEFINRLVQLLAALQGIATGRDTASPQVTLEWQRPAALLEPLVPDVITWAGYPQHVGQTLLGDQHPSRTIVCRLQASLVPTEVISIQKDHNTLRADRERVRFAAIVCQRTLRAFLALNAWATAKDSQDSAWSRALLVHRKAAMPAAPKHSGLTADPREDTVLSDIAHSARRGLEGLARSWQRLQHGPVSPAKHWRPKGFAENHIGRSLACPFALRNILVEEQHLAEALSNFAAKVACRASGASPHPYNHLELTKLARDCRRAASRLIPNGSARSLLPLVILAAVGAAITRRKKGFLAVRLEFSAAGSPPQPPELLLRLPPEGCLRIAPKIQTPQPQRGTTKAA